MRTPHRPSGSAVHTPAAGTHSYRDRRFASAGVWYRRSALFLLEVFAVVVGFGDHDPRDWITVLALAPVVLLLAAVAGRRACREIRLNEDGMCEFVTKRGVVRVRAGQIRSVRYRSSSDGDSE